MKSFVFLKKNGFSILELMIALGIMGVASLGTSRLVSNLAISSQQTQAMIDIHFIKTDLQRVLAHKDPPPLPETPTCEKNFAGIALPILPKTTVDIADVHSYRPEDPGTIERSLLHVNTPLPTSPQFTVDTLRVGDFVANVGDPTLYTFSIEASFRRTSAETNFIIPRNIKLQFILAKVAAGKIVSCIYGDNGIIPLAATPTPAPSPAHTADDFLKKSICPATRLYPGPVNLPQGYSTQFAKNLKDVNGASSSLVATCLNGVWSPGFLGPNGASAGAGEGAGGGDAGGGPGSG